MSHVTDAKMKVRDLEAAAEAAPRCGMTLMIGQKTFNWFGRFVGDSVPPAGRNPAEYGRCEHALRLKDHRSGDYEIGLVPALDGDGYDLMWDTWGTSGRRLAEAAGPNLDKFRREYSAAVLTKKARQKLAPKGFTVAREDLLNGRIRLRLRRR